MKRLAIVALLVGALAPAPGEAHQAGFTRGEAEFAADGTFHLDLDADLDALLAGVEPGHLDEALYRDLLALPPPRLRDRVDALRRDLATSVRLIFDGGAVEAAVVFPEMGEGGPPDRDLPGSSSGPARTPGRRLRFQGTVPAGAREFTFAASPAYGPIILTVRDAAVGREERLVVAPMRVSEPFALAAPGRRSSAVAFLRYVGLGYEHILPRGMDHILFVLGLYLLSTRLRPLLVQVTSFTLAHSATLALSLYGVFSLPPRVVEPLIALSIAWVAVENILTAELKPWRAAVVFLFGLMHGLGFAGALREVGLPRHEFASALVGFNVGVELGQLSVILLALLAAGWFRRRVWYRARLVVPVSAAIAAVGCFWAVQRIFLA